jgi:uncharacterized protein YkwD
MRIFFLAAIVSLLFPIAVHAGECYEYPTTPLNGSATVNSAVFLRSTPCMDDSVVLATLSAGANVPVIGEQDGWYNVKNSDGVSGWVWQSFLTVSSSPYVATEPTASPAPTPTTSSASLTSRTIGYILLQVESHGEAWYVNPEDSKRYYMKDGPTAYEMMRAFGLGISNADLNRAFDGDTSVLSRVKGKILLQVENHGEAYYVHPDTGALHYLEDGDAAYTIMRELSLGITNADLAGIPSAEFSPVPYENDTESENAEISISNEQYGNIPNDVDTVALNEYWLEIINDLRSVEGLRTLALDQRFVDTASEYAGMMDLYGYLNHQRPDGSSMHEWINTKGLDFTERYEPGGWTVNYFSENIAWGPYDQTQEGTQDLLDAALGMFLAEGEGGDHYDTIYHVDWNSVGVGFAFGDDKTYVVFHYGSLE